MRPHKLDSVLPLMEFRSLKDVRLHLYDTSLNQVLPSKDPLRLFFRALAASLEALSIMSNRDDVASHISDILSDQVAGTLVPKLRELTFYALIRNPGTLEGIGLNFPALRKLKMWPITIVASSP
ncbi:hypothetical protein AB1N83_009428, partial [Pleurotus pulmonarius]